MLSYLLYQILKPLKICNVVLDRLRILTTVFILSIRTSELLTILVLKFEHVQFTARCCV